MQGKAPCSINGNRVIANFTSSALYKDRDKCPEQQHSHSIASTISGFYSRSRLVCNGSAEGAQKASVLTFTRFTSRRDAGIQATVYYD